MQLVHISVSEKKALLQSVMLLLAPRLAGVPFCLVAFAAWHQASFRSDQDCFPRHLQSASNHWKAKAQASTPNPEDELFAAWSLLDPRLSSLCRDA